MAGEILTPSSIWSDVKIESIPSVEIIGEYKTGNVTLTRMRIDGRTVNDGTVKIYAVLAKKQSKKQAPAIFILQKFTDGADETLATDLAKKGYIAFVVNVGGEDGVNTNHTIYPPSLEYANYLDVNFDENYIIDGDVKKTYWYEWGLTARYALKYLISLPEVSKIAGLGIGDSATVLWHMTASNKFDCLAFILNAGWRAYKGNFKFQGNVDQQFSDSQLNYLAGIEPQAYANHVTAPTIILSATNSADYDFERLHDTYARINGKLPAITSSSVGMRDCVSKQDYENLLKFLKQNLSAGEKSVCSIPKDPNIKCDVKNGKINCQVSVDKKQLKEVCVYVAEEKFNPALRQWQRVDLIQSSNGDYQCEYTPYNKSKVAFLFVKATYKNGYIIDSDVVCKKFTESEIERGHKSKIIYSSREENSDSAFYPAGNKAKKPYGMVIDQDFSVEEKTGAMDITGITSKTGLLSFRIGLEKYRPLDDGILLLDAYLKDGGKITVKLVCDYFGNKREYVASLMVNGGEVWHNLKFTLNNFKTAEGMALRTLKDVQAIEIHADGEYLINNVLWV